MTSPVRPVDLDVAAQAPVGVVLALGSNLGDRAATLRSAVAMLRDVDGLLDLRVSPVFETPPVGGPEQGPYLNAVVAGRTTLAPRAVLGAAQRVEAAHGRERVVRWGPRTLDVDVIAVGDLVSSDAELTLPHPRARERGFVLVPWAVVDPAAVLPGAHGGPVAELATAAADSAQVRRTDDDLEAAP